MKAKLIALLRQYAPAIAALLVRKVQDKRNNRRTY